MKRQFLAMGAAAASIFSAIPTRAQFRIEPALPTSHASQPAQAAQLGKYASDAVVAPLSQVAWHQLPSDPAPLPISGVPATVPEISDPQAFAANPHAAVESARAPYGAQPTAATHPDLFTAPHVAHEPIVWPYGLEGAAVPYNPTVTVMTRNWCADGLWDNYAAQRAAECARIQSDLHGGHHHRFSGQRSAGCEGRAGGIFNRYLPSTAACPSGCDPAAASLVPPAPVAAPAGGLPDLAPPLPTVPEFSSAQWNTLPPQYLSAGTHASVLTPADPLAFPPDLPSVPEPARSAPASSPSTLPSSTPAGVPAPQSEQPGLLLPDPPLPDSIRPSIATTSRPATMLAQQPAYVPFR
jgi:hypothetical protein